MEGVTLPGGVQSLAFLINIFKKKKSCRLIKGPAKKIFVLSLDHTIKFEDPELSFGFFWLITYSKKLFYFILLSDA